MTTWLEHVKKVHASGSTSFKESLKRASASWKKTKGKAAPKAAAAAKAPKKKKRRRRRAEPDSTEVQEEAAAPKKRKRKKKTMPKIPAASFRNVDSVSL